jgi:predicted GNAT family acetyltransferase
MIEVKQNNDEKHGSFEAFIDGRRAGMMTYTWAGEERFIIDHTEVEEAYNGKGVGKEMLLAAVDFARKNGKKLFRSARLRRPVSKRVRNFRMSW